MTTIPNVARLRRFVQQFALLLDGHPTEPAILNQGGAMLAQLVAHDDWLPEAYTLPNPQRYQQYLLHADALERFSVVSFVHVYGANIGSVKRSVYLEDGTRKPFISGYSNTTLPNFWDLSNEFSAGQSAGR
jgi:predicted metal-dependent enzyme (double-stranded beta helix superfamily)